MERLNYFIRRLLLIVPTFLGITLLCFTLIQFVPGGPVEQMLLQMRGADTLSDSGFAEGAAISEEYRRQVERHFGFDRPIPVRYWRWLVADRMGMRMESYRYPNRNAWELIRSRFAVSLIFGITGFLLTYLVCIPLGIAKALRHGKTFDWLSSVIVFAGYALPAFALGMILKMLFTGINEQHWDLLPAYGFRSDHYGDLSFAGRVIDTARHMALPVLCYVAGNFAVLTLLMKNSLMEQVRQDYVRAVLARGASASRAVWGHAVRNALIPIATGFGGIMTLMFAGSVIIEQIFDIPGMGLLSLEAIVTRDYAVFMAILALTSVLGLVGNVISDFCYVLIDPRINFQKRAQ